METRSLPLQNVQKVCRKYGFHLIKHTPFIKFIVFRWYHFFFWSALIKHTYYLVRAIVFLS